MEFTGFTHTPVDFQAVLHSASTCFDHPRLEPFFNYYNTSHAEGPKKWYVTACPGDMVEVYLPARGILFDFGIQAFGSEEGIDGHFKGEKVLINIQAQFDVSSDITVFYQHLTLRDEVNTMLQDSPNRFVIFDAGAHIGYAYLPTKAWYTIDFGVRDRRVDAGLTQDPSERWNSMVNPLDYFNDDLRGSILGNYQETYDSLVEGGVTPYSDIEDSRMNINEPNTIWGYWFKNDLPDMWDGSAWSVVTLINSADLHQETYWKTLEEFPGMSGLFVEQSRAEVIRQPLYEGQPIVRSKFYILSGDDRAGVGRIGEERGNDPRIIYLKYELQPNTADELDAMLMMESFQSLEAAEAREFSDRAVVFRRKPCRDSKPSCY